jgi:hypothetical protein
MNQIGLQRLLLDCKFRLNVATFSPSNIISLVTNTSCFGHGGLQNITVATQLFILPNCIAEGFFYQNNYKT